MGIVALMNAQEIIKEPEEILYNVPLTSVMRAGLKRRQWCEQDGETEEEAGSWTNNSADQLQLAGLQSNNFNVGIPNFGRFSTCSDVLKRFLK